MGCQVKVLSSYGPYKTSSGKATSSAQFQDVSTHVQTSQPRIELIHCLSMVVDAIPEEVLGLSTRAIDPKASWLH